PVDRGVVSEEVLAVLMSAATVSGHRKGRSIEAGVRARKSAARLDSRSGRTSWNRFRRYPWPPPYRTRAVQQLIKGLAWGPPTSRAVWAALESPITATAAPTSTTSLAATSRPRCARTARLTAHDNRGVLSIGRRGGHLLRRSRRRESCPHEGRRPRRRQTLGRCRSSGGSEALRHGLVLQCERRLRPCRS